MGKLSNKEISSMLDSPVKKSKSSVNISKRQSKTKEELKKVNEEIKLKVKEEVLKYSNPSSSLNKKRIIKKLSEDLGITKVDLVADWVNECLAEIKRRTSAVSSKLKLSPTSKDEAIDLVDVEDSDSEDVATLNENINKSSDIPIKSVKVDLQNLNSTESLREENKKLKSELDLARTELTNLEVKIPKMIEDFKKYLDKSEKKHNTETIQMKDEINELKARLDLSSKETDSMVKIKKLQDQLKQYETKMKTTEKEIVNLKLTNKQSLQSINKKDQELDDANKKLKKVQDDLKNKSANHNKDLAHQKELIIKKFEKEIDLKMKKISDVSKTVTSLEDEKTENKAQIQKQTQKINELSKSLKEAYRNNVQFEELKGKVASLIESNKRLDAQKTQLLSDVKTLKKESNSRDEKQFMLLQNIDDQKFKIQDLESKLKEQDKEQSKATEQKLVVKSKEVDNLKAEIDEYKSLLVKKIEEIDKLKEMNVRKDDRIERNDKRFKDFEESIKKIKEVAENNERENERKSKRMALVFNEKIEAKDIQLREKALQHSESISKLTINFKEELSIRDMNLREYETKLKAHHKEVLEKDESLANKDIELRKFASRIVEMNKDFDREREDWKFTEINIENNIRHQMLMQYKEIKDNLIEEHKQELENVKEIQEKQFAEEKFKLETKLEEKRNLLHRIVRVVSYKPSSDVGEEKCQRQVVKLPLSYNWPLIHVSGEPEIVEDKMTTSICTITQPGHDLLNVRVPSIYIVSNAPLVQASGLKRKCDEEENVDYQITPKRRRINVQVLMITYSWPIVPYQHEKQIGIDLNFVNSILSFEFPLSPSRSQQQDEVVSLEKSGPLMIKYDWPLVLFIEEKTMIQPRTSRKRKIEVLNSIFKKNKLDFDNPLMVPGKSCIYNLHVDQDIHQKPYKPLLMVTYQPSPTNVCEPNVHSIKIDKRLLVIEESTVFPLNKKRKTVPNYSYRISSPAVRMTRSPWKLSSKSYKRSFFEFLDKQSEEDYDDSQPPLKKFKLGVESCSNNFYVDSESSSLAIVNYILHIVLTVL